MPLGIAEGEEQRSTATKGGCNRGWHQRQMNPELATQAVIDWWRYRSSHSSGTPLSSSFVGQTRGDVRVGSSTPRGTPSWSVNGYSQSWSPGILANLEIKVRKKGCSSATPSSSVAPKHCRILLNNSSEKGWFFSPQEINIWTAWFNSDVSSIIFCPIDVIPVSFLSGGTRLPPPSLRGLVRKPSWTTTCSSMRERRCESGRVVGRPTM